MNPIQEHGVAKAKQLFRERFGGKSILAFECLVENSGISPLDFPVSEYTARKYKRCGDLAIDQLAAFGLVTLSEDHLPYFRKDKSQKWVKVPNWQPIETAPRDGSYILLAAPSGYTTTPLRAAVGCWSDGGHYGPSAAGWRTHSGDWFTDAGKDATYWMPLPSMP